MVRRIIVTPNGDWAEVTDEYKAEVYEVAEADYQRLVNGEIEAVFGISDSATLLFEIGAETRL